MSTTYHVTTTGNHVAHCDDRVVLVAIRPADEHVVIVSPLYRRDILITATHCSFYAIALSYAKSIFVVLADRGIGLIYRLRERSW